MDTQSRSRLYSQDTINSAQCPLLYIKHCPKFQLPYLLPRFLWKSPSYKQLFTFLSIIPRGSRSSSRQSSTSSQGSEKDYALSVNIYGRGDASKRDPPAHWGAMLSRRGEKHGDLYHVRKNEEFFFEDPVLRRPVESNTSYGRSEITYLSNRRKDSAARILDAYGKKESNLPDVNETH